MFGRIHEWQKLGPDFASWKVLNFLIVQKKVNMTGLRSLERLAYSWLISGNLDFGRVPAIPRIDKRALLCLTCWYKQSGMWLMLNTFWESRILVRTRERLSTWPAQDSESVTSFHDWQHLTRFHNVLLGKLSMSCVTLVRDDPWNLRLVSLELYHMHLFPLVVVLSILSL